MKMHSKISNYIYSCVNMGIAELLGILRSYFGHNFYMLIRL